MSNLRNDKEAEWPENITEEFLKLVYDRVKQYPPGQFTFKGSHWNDINTELRAKTGVVYTSHQLQGKYGRCKSLYKLFNDILNHTGVTFDAVTNWALADEWIWEKILKMNRRLYTTLKNQGWEESANDSRVFIDAITKPEYGFPMPTQGYPNIKGFLAPYRGENYHLNQFRGQGRIRNKQALFNYRHSSLRNVIERCFGILKARFPILKYIHGYPLRRQVQIPIACAMHNFIRMNDAMDKLFTEHVMQAVREDIANAIWGDCNR